MTISIILFGLLLRLPLLNQSFWLDEAIQALALMGKKGPLLKYALADFQPPLYHFLLKGWTNIFGYSEIALRTPSLIFALLSIYFTIRLTKSLTQSSRLSQLAGFLLAINPLHIYYSQEARTYMLTTFLVTASFYYLFKILKSKKQTLPYLIFTILALYTSYLAWIAIFLQLLYLLFQKEKKLFKYPAASFLSLLPWLPSLYRQLQIGLSTASSSPAWAQVVGGFELARIPRTWLKFILGRVSLQNRILYLVLALILFLYHAYLLFKAKIKNHPLLLTWLAGTILVTFLLTLFLPVYQYFRLLFTLPAYLILLTLAFKNLKNPQLHTFLLTLISLASLVFFWLTPRFHKEAWRSLVEDINRKASQTHAVAMPSLAQNAPLEYYQLSLPQIEPKKSIDKPYERIYYIQYAQDLFDSQKQGIKNLESQSYQLESEKTYPGLYLKIYTKEPGKL